MMPFMNPEDTEPLSEEEAVRKMANIGAIMEGAGAGFTEDDMRLLRDVFASGSAVEDEMERFIEQYRGADDEEEDDEDDEIGLNSLDW